MIAYGVCAHEARLDRAIELLKSLPVDRRVISVDNGTKGELRNHDDAWLAAYELAVEEELEWCVVLEDDAEPIWRMTEYLPQTLANVPEPGIVSLYTGTGRPPQFQAAVQAACDKAQHSGAAWLQSRRLLWGVAVAMPTAWVPTMLDYVGLDMSPYDFRLGHYAAGYSLPVYYTYPSMVDHADGPTLIQHQDGQPRTEARKAWATGVPMMNREAVVF